MNRAQLNARIAAAWDEEKRAAARAITLARLADPVRRAAQFEKQRAAMLRRRADYGIPEAYLPLYRKARRVLGKRKAAAQIRDLIARETASPSEARA